MKTTDHLKRTVVLKGYSEKEATSDNQMHEEKCGINHNHRSA